MLIPYTARFTFVIFLVSVLFSLFIIQPGLRIAGVLMPRQAFIIEHTLLWKMGWWLWLAAIFSWMLLLVALLWSYLPAHRVATMLVTGVTLMAATLAIVGVIVWMAILPIAVTTVNANEMTPMVDAFALGLIGAGCFMGGTATAWICFDLFQQRLLPGGWILFGFFAGLCALPTPLLLPTPYALFCAWICWLIWSLFLAMHRRLPRPLVE